MTLPKARARLTKINFYRNARDPGFLFSRELVHRLSTTTSYTRQEIENLLWAIGREFSRQILKGEPVGLPQSFAIYSERKPGHKVKRDGTLAPKSPRLKVRLAKRVKALYGPKIPAVTGDFRDQKVRISARMIKIRNDGRVTDEMKLPVYTDENFRPRRKP